MTRQPPTAIDQHHLSPGQLILLQIDHAQLGKQRKVKGYY
jgi:hypothetical protein